MPLNNRNSSNKGIERTREEFAFIIEPSVRAADAVSVRRIGEEPANNSANNYFANSASDIEHLIAFGERL